MGPIRALIAAIALMITAPATLAAELLMIEEPGCVWCEVWNEEIGGIYNLTDEGKRAPLRRMDIGDPLPDGITLSMRAQYTPTFVLIEDGREIGRIEGYPGEHFFWGMLNRLLDKLPPGSKTDLQHAGRIVQTL